MKIYLLGGRPCSGKTTIAYQLGQKYNIDVKYLDVYAQELIDNSTPKTPNIFSWKGISLTQAMNGSPEVLFDTYLKAYDEMIPFFLDMISKLESKKIILEGSILTPKFVSLLEKQYDTQVCYLLTNDNFVREQYIKRDYAQNMIKEVDGKQSLENLLERDSIFAKYIIKEIKKYNYPSLEIHNKSEPQVNISLVEEILNL